MNFWLKVCAISADFRSRRIWGGHTFRKLRPRAGCAPLAAATSMPTMRHQSARFTMRGGRGVGIPLSRHFHLEARGDFGLNGAGINNLRTGIGHAARRQPRSWAGGAGLGEKGPPTKFWEYSSSLR